MPWWLAGASLYMGSFSAFAFVAFGSVAYNNGVLGALVGAGGVAGWFLCAMFMAQRWRRANVSTPTEYLETRFSPIVRQLVVWISIIIGPLQTGLRLFAFGLIVNGILGYNTIDVILCAALVMCLYSTMGGLWSVVLTDSLQFAVLVVGIVPLVILSVAEVGGIGGLLDLGESGFFDFKRSNLSIWWLVTWWVTEIVNTLASFQGVQRFSAVKTETDAKKAALFAAILLIPTTFLVMTPSLLGAALFPDIDGQLIFATMTKSLLPTGLVALMLGAMCAATMSSLDSLYNVDAALITRDVYKRNIAPRASSGNLLLVSRLSTVLVITCSALVAVTFAAFNMQTFSILEQIQSRVLIIVWVLFVIGILYRRATTRIFIATLLMSLLASGIFLFSNISTNASRLILIIFTGALVIVSGLFFTGSSTDKARSESFFQKISTTQNSRSSSLGSAGESKHQSHRSILKILAFGLISFACIPAILTWFTPSESGARLVELAVSFVLMLLGSVCLYAAFRRAVD